MLTIYDLKEKHKKEEEDFINNCKHQYEDKTSAIIKCIDVEEDEEMYMDVYYEEWEECSICGTKIEKKKEKAIEHEKSFPDDFWNSAFK